MRPSIALACALALAPGVARALDSPPRVAVEGPGDLAWAASHLGAWHPERLSGFQRLIGLPDAGPPIRVVLATEDSVVAAAAPSWIAGFARDDELVVLFPGRVPVYPNASLDELLGHEVAHVLVARAAGGHAVPRWFNEGLAMMAEDAWDWGDRSRAALALLRGQSYAVAVLDERFAGDRGEVQGAYAVSEALVRDLVGRHGRQAPAAILRRLAGGQPFDEAFTAAVGVSVAELEGAFWRRHVFWNRWLPFLGSGNTLWIAVTLLALLAIWRRRRRDRLQAELWELEERSDPEWLN
jgi:Peptidase MA superfamily